MKIYFQVAGALPIFDSAVCLVIQPSYLIFMLKNLNCMFYSSLEILVLFHFTRTLWSHSMSYLEEVYLWQARNWLLLIHVLCMCIPKFGPLILVLMAVSLCSSSAIGHVSHTKKNWEHGRLFTLQDQIDHKMDFIQHELKNIDAPILLVGHSIGAYISMEMFRRSPDKVIYYVGLYPFLALNSESRKQTTIGRISASPILCAALSSIVAFLGLLPRWASGFIVSNSLGKSWSSTAVEALCSHLLKYHTIRNVLYMAMTEFTRVRLLYPQYICGGELK